MSTNYRSLIQVLEEKSAILSTKYAFTYLEDGESAEHHLTYAALSDNAKKLGARLQQVTKKGDRVLLFFQPGLEFIVGFFGCIYAGAIAIPSFPPKLNKALEKLLGIMEDSGAKIILTTSSICRHRHVQEFFNRHHFQVICIDQTGEEGWPEWNDPRLDLKDIAFLQYTSGSTGVPKGVIITHKNLLANQRLIQSAFHQTQASVIVGWLPFYHDMGLIGNIIHPVFLGARAVLMSPLHFLEKPVRWLQAISKYKATTSGGPNFAYDLCIQKISADELSEVDLSTWTVAFCGAEPVRANTLRAFTAVFGKYKFSDTAFQPCYGMAEATLLISAHKHQTPAQIQRFSVNDAKIVESVEEYQQVVELVSCGRVSGYDIIIACLDGKMDDNRVGEIWIRGESVSPGYWHGEEPVSDDQTGRPGGYFQTGDMGLMYEGELYITGRLKDMIISNGKNIYLHDIETAIIKKESEFKAGSCSVFTVEKNEAEAIVAVCETENVPVKFPALLADIRKVLFEWNLVDIEDIILVRKGTIPKTTSGKVQRHACKAAYLNQALKVLGSWGGLLKSEHTLFRADQRLNDELEETLLKIFEMTLGKKPAVDESFFNLRLDSIKIAQLSILLSEELNRDIDVEMLFLSETVSELAKLIQAQEIQQPSKAKGDSLTANYPLAVMQQSIWLSQNLYPDKSFFHIPVLLRLDEYLSIDALEFAWNYLINKYESLRAVITAKEGVPLQIIKPPEDFRLKELMFNNREELNLYLVKQANLPLLTDDSPPWRCEVLTDAGQQVSYLFFIAHQIIIDGYSMKLLYQEVIETAAFFHTPARLERQAGQLQFRDFVDWETQYLQGSKAARDKVYWTLQLDGAIPVAGLPFDFTGQKDDFSSQSEELVIDASTVSKLKSKADDYRASLFEILLTGYYILMHKLTGEKDITLGIPVINRPLAGLSGGPGLYLNVLPIRISIDNQESVERLLHKVKMTLKEAFIHKAYPYLYMLDDMGKRGQPDTQSMTAVSFNGLTFLGKEDDILYQSFQRNIGLDSNYKLNCYITELDQSLYIRLDFNQSLFNTNTIRVMLDKYAAILASLSDELSTEITLVNAPDITPVTSHSDDAPWYNPLDCIPQLFYKQSKQFATNIAVSMEGRAITYDELNKLSNKWARFIKRRYQDIPIIGICVAHNENIATAVWAVLKSGKAYVCLDTDLSPDRLQYIIDECDLSAIITDESAIPVLAKIPTRNSLSLIALTAYYEQAFYESSDDLSESIAPGSLAYVLYTSGSTGQPKGVKQTHANLLHYISSYTMALQLTEHDNLSGFSSYNYDSFNNDFYGALLNGATYVPYSMKLMPENENVYHWAIDMGITIWHSIPSMFRVFGFYCMNQNLQLPGLRILKMTGEPVRAKDFELFKYITAANCEFVVSLGASEATLLCINSFGHEYLPKKAIFPVGFPVKRTAIHIVDENLNPLGLLETGEILVQSDHLSPGYLHHDGRFFQKEGRSFYRTGDLGRKLIDGRLEWLGRIDTHIKLRGVKVDLGEVEFQILKFPGIVDVAVIKHTTGESEDLVCFIVAPDNISLTGLKSFLIRFLPLSSIPKQFVMLSQIPRTSTGKADLRSLPVPAPEPSQSNYTAPGNDIERKLADIWCSVLNVERVGIFDNFFALGGNSLLGIQIISRVRQMFNIELTFQAIFENPNIVEMAKHMLRKEQVLEAEHLPISRLSRERFKISLDQLKS